MLSEPIRRWLIAATVVLPAGGLAAQTGDTGPDRRCTEPVPDIRAVMQHRAVEKYPRQEAEELIEEARELCEQGETGRALYKLSLAMQVLQDSAIEDPTSEDPTSE